MSPIHGGFGGGRGRPIDRDYIESFLARHAADVQGRVLKVAASDYTHRFGGNRVHAAPLLHVDPAHPGATWTADLADDAALPTSHFDAFICTQTLRYIFDLPRAVATVHRILEPGGVLLLTVPGISQINPYDRARWGEHWRFTPQSVQRLLGGTFGEGAAEVLAHFNVLADIGFLHELACEDLDVAELDHTDDRYPMLITARVQKSAD
ncbi:MAG: class I SAM-dependent methyltransferase [Rubrivivax sp.]|nr:class I SAM-dependent methyltransferase [Rubrivivax sp.]